MFVPLLDTLIFDQHMLFFSEKFNGFSYLALAWYSTFTVLKTSRYMPPSPPIFKQKQDGVHVSNPRTVSTLVLVFSNQQTLPQCSVIYRHCFSKCCCKYCIKQKWPTSGPLSNARHQLCELLFYIPLLAENHQKTHAPNKYMLLLSSNLIYGNYTIACRN